MASSEPSAELFRQEEERLRKLHPTPEDVPGCMKLFDDFLLCNGESFVTHGPMEMLIVKYKQ